MTSRSQASRRSHLIEERTPTSPESLGGGAYLETVHASATGLRQAVAKATFCPGVSNHDIAQRLGIGEYTVKAHVEMIFSKLNAAGRAEAVTRGFESGILGL